MVLHEVAADILAVLEQMDDNPDVWADTLESLDYDFDDKVENLAAYVKELEAESAALKAEIDNLKTRKAAKDSKAASLKAYIKSQMRAVGKTKVDRPMACVRYYNRGAKYVVDDERALIEWAEKYEEEDLLKYSPPKLVKAEIDSRLKAGKAVPFVHEEEVEVVSIK